MTPIKAGAETWQEKAGIEIYELLKDWRDTSYGSRTQHIINWIEQNKELICSQEHPAPSIGEKEWINVEDSLPEIRKPVLILTDYGKMATAYITDKTKPTYSWTDWMRAEHGYGSVTHWMPLPEPPKTTE